MTRYVRHPILGRVTITMRSNSTHMRARLINDEVKVSVPTDVTAESLMQFLDRCAEKFASVPKNGLKTYSDGQLISCPDVTFVIKRQSHLPDRILAKPALPVSYIEVGNALDMNHELTTKTISRVLARLASVLAEKLIIEKARRIAGEIGIAPRHWKISSGHRRLGYCDSTRTIALSYMLIFLPADLQEYIICHELAHLTEMNHGPRFHALCNAYCNGREKELAARLKSVKTDFIGF